MSFSLKLTLSRARSSAYPSYFPGVFPVLTEPKILQSTGEGVLGEIRDLGDACFLSFRCVGQWLDSGDGCLIAIWRAFASVVCS